jgi:hypothetical protein
LKKNHQDYAVYNLLIGGERISDRTKTIDMMIRAKPDIVVLGIAADDFSDRRVLRNTESLIEQKYLPDLSEYSSEILSSLGSFFNHEGIEHPRWLVGQFLFTINEKFNPSNNKQQSITSSKSPFVQIVNSEREITDKNKLKAPLYNEFGKVLDPIDNEQLVQFNEILKKLKASNIKIIIFTTPYSRVYLDSVPSSNVENFNLILEQISDEFDIEIYSLTDKYADLNIWNDYQHLVLSNESIIYSDDVAKIILSEIKS